MLKPVMEEALNKQLNAELYSAYLYWSMAAYFHDLSLDGFAHWMRLQAREEVEHAEKFYDYIVERGGRVLLAAINNPETEWNSPQAVFEMTLAHEQKVTGMINELVELAMAEKDHATCNFLQWFVEEQVEEEATADGILQQLKLIGDNKVGLLLLDRELGQRKE